MDKGEIRQKMLEQRNRLSLEEQEMYAFQITERVLNSRMYSNCKNLCIYQAFRNEVSCDRIKRQAFQDKKQVFVPVTDFEHKTMEFYLITEKTQWQTGAYGILEPVHSAVAPVLDGDALILMPGLVFDRKKHRIGYGGGYYDKYLSNHTGHTTMALCYHFQVVEDMLPYEEHDRLPDYIVTDKEIW